MTTKSIDQLVAEMTVAEKIGQMTQVSYDSITPAEVADYAIGSVLSGGNGNPEPNKPAVWRDLVGSFVAASADSRLGIPILYGTDAVHGHSNVRGATIFPHNISLGAVDDPELTHRIARITAREMAATGVRWAFAPTVAVPQDIRWGRTYEGYGRRFELVARLGAATVTGLQQASNDAPSVLACAKHFVGDGGTTWGTAPRFDWNDWWDGWGPGWQIDQGDLRVSDQELRTVHLPPYVAAIEAGAMSVMASYNSWNGARCHSHGELVTGLLKKELGFRGFVVSDWMAVDQIDPDYDTAVTAAINAGIDMVMVPIDFRRFLDTMARALAAGAIPMQRVDDAVRRILGAKEAVGVSADEAAENEIALDVVGDASHRAVAAEAARRSAVLLKDTGVLPLGGPAGIDVAGAAADDIGLQCGGWTVGWQGGVGRTTEGSTLVEGLRAALPNAVRYDPSGRFPDMPPAEVGVVCLAEDPYAEGPGDRALPDLSGEPREVFARMRARCRRLILVVYSGRPLVITDLISATDTVIAAWLPGSEASGIADLLLGEYRFEGRLPQPWPLTVDDLGSGEESQLFPIGHPYAAGAANHTGGSAQ